MAETPQTNDPYAPPPRYKNKSGAMVRVALLAAMLAGAAWGYMSFSNAPQTALVPVEEQSFAEARTSDGSHRVKEPAATAPTPAPATPQAAPAQSAAPASPEPVPPPSITTAPSSTPAPLPSVDTPAGD